MKPVNILVYGVILEPLDCYSVRPNLFHIVCPRRHLKSGKDIRVLQSEASVRAMLETPAPIQTLKLRSPV